MTDEPELARWYGYFQHSKANVFTAVDGYVLEEYNRHMLQILTIHEAYPGHLALRLTQLKFYLRAVCNAILHHKLHCSNMSDDDAMKLAAVAPMAPAAPAGHEFCFEPPVAGSIVGA